MKPLPGASHDNAHSVKALCCKKNWFSNLQRFPHRSLGDQGTLENAIKTTAWVQCMIRQTLSYRFSNIMELSIYVKNHDEVHVHHLKHASAQTHDMRPAALRKLATFQPCLMGGKARPPEPRCPPDVFLFTRCRCVRKKSRFR